MPGTGEGGKAIPFPAVPVPEPLTGIGQIAPTIRVQAWKNLGRATIGSAIQSQFHAIATGDTDYLQQSTVLDPVARRVVASMHEQTSASIRAQYPTPESFAAFLLASRPAMEGYILMTSTQESPDDVRVAVGTLAAGEGKFRGERQQFRRASDGTFQRVIGSAELSYWRDMLKWDKELSRSRVWTAAK